MAVQLIAQPGCVKHSYQVHFCIGHKEPQCRLSTRNITSVPRAKQTMQLFCIAYARYANTPKKEIILKWAGAAQSKVHGVQRVVSSPFALLNPFTETSF